MNSQHVSGVGDRGWDLHVISHHFPASLLRDGFLVSAGNQDRAVELGQIHILLSHSRDPVHADPELELRSNVNETPQAGEKLLIFFLAQGEGLALLSDAENVRLWEGPAGRILLECVR